MVDPSSDRVSRAPPYSFCPSVTSCFGYAAFTLFGSPSQMILLHSVFPTDGLLPVRSPLLRESLLISFPKLLRWFTSLCVTLPAYFIQPLQ